jgi:hypothetical protein
VGGLSGSGKRLPGAWSCTASAARRRSACGVSALERGMRAAVTHREPVNLCHRQTSAQDRVANDKMIALLMKCTLKAFQILELNLSLGSFFRRVANVAYWNSMALHFAGQGDEERAYSKLMQTEMRFY